MAKADLTVLVVDDVSAVRANVKELLKSDGFRTVLMAANGAEAKHFLSTQKIQLVLCDWHMDPFNGFELLEFVRKSSDPNLANVGFLMLTADSVKDQVLKAIQAGVDDYLVKPLTIGQIQDRVAKCLLKRKLV